jgi:DNA-binding MarR family transcriptional regulator
MSEMRLKILRNIRAELHKYGIQMKEIGEELEMTGSNVSSVLRRKSHNDAVILLAKEKIREKKELERKPKN